MSVCHTICFYLAVVGIRIQFTSTQTQDTKRACLPSEPSFKALLQSDCFVDKSMFIRDFDDLKWNLNVVSAPKGFGKTANLQMLKTFLEIQDGEERPVLTDGCRLFQERNLTIYHYNNGSFFKKYCGQQPVIYVSFKSVTGRTFNQVLSALKEALHDAFMEHKYAKYHPDMYDKEVRLIEDYTKPRYKNLTADYMVNNGLKRLTEILFQIFGKRTTVLIDDYDAPIWHMLDFQFRKQQVERTVDYFNRLMTPFLKDNNFIETALINTYVRPHEGLWNYSYNILHLPFLGKHPLVRYYGLTTDEVNAKLTEFQIDTNAPAVKEYYNGYEADVPLYRTSSVLNYLQRESLKGYFRLEHLNALFLQPEVKRLVTTALNGEAVGIESFNQKLSVKDLLVLKEIFRKRTCTEPEARLFMYFLLIHGYFKQTPIGNNQIALYIPNKEIRQHLYNAINNITVS